MKKLYRPKKDRKVLGLCAGLGIYFKIDPSFIRLIFVFLCFITGVIPLLITYFVLSLIIPEYNYSVALKPYKILYKSNKNKIFLGVCGGLAEFFQIDANIFRIIFVVVSFLTLFFPLFFTYLAAAFLLQNKFS